VTVDIAAPAAPAPARLSQGTAIEQSRAVAQVQAAVLVARQYPREEQRALRAMAEACARPQLANRAFYEYRRGGERVTGPTIRLAQELARIWGNVDFGLAELSLDAEAGQSEMLAYAWDLESNARFSQIVIVQHVRDKKVNGVKVAERIKDQRDVYELNTSNAARRLREAIRRIVPDWFFEEAESRCLATLENPGDGLTLAQRIARMATAFERYGIDVPRLEARVGKPVSEWTGFDLGQLTIAGESLKRGDITAEDAFPQARVTAAEVAGQTASPTTAPAPSAERHPTPDAPPIPAPVDEPADQHPTEAPPTLMKQIVDAGRERGWTAVELTADFKTRAGGTDPANAAEKELHAYLDWLLKQPHRGQATAKPTKRMLDKLHAQLSDLNVAEAERHETLSLLVGRQIISANELSKDEVQKLVNQLENLLADDNPAAAMDGLLAAAVENAASEDIA
jgi:hypothetical protein